MSTPTPPIYPSVSFLLPAWLAKARSRAINGAAMKIQAWLNNPGAPLTVSIPGFIKITLAKDIGSSGM